jgi:uncharacterized protein (DUF849 family)
LLLQAALNGNLTKKDHPALPISVKELSRDAVACVAAGARAIHLHPRDHVGNESLDPELIDRVVSEVRRACSVPVGVSSGAWIETDPERRLEHVRGWHAPDYASVNLIESDSLAIMETLLQIGIGIEAGVSTVADAEALALSGLGGRVTRVLIEISDVQAKSSAIKALELVEEIHEALNRLHIDVPRLQHGEGTIAWAVLRDAIRRGVDTRIGLEDTQHGPNGEVVRGNLSLVDEARKLGA